MGDRNRLRLMMRSILILLISAVILLMMMAMVVQKPPLEEFMEYEMILAASPGIRKNETDRQRFLMAEHFRNAAISEWQEQESRWLYLRNYNEARRMMNVAISIVEEISSVQTSEITTALPINAIPTIAAPTNLTSESIEK